MSWQEDGSAELDEAVRDIRTKWTPEQIAERLDKWGRDGVTIQWADFPGRAVLETAAKILRAANINTAKE